MNVFMEGAALHQPFHQSTQPNQIKKEFSIWFDFIDFFIVDEINGIELNWYYNSNW